MLESLAQPPYVTVAFPYLIKYFHEQGVPIEYMYIDPFGWSDDIYMIVEEKDLLYKIAENFDDA